jgi:hypothetical protein
MSSNIKTKIHVFTDTELKKHDLEIIKATAKAVNQSTTRHIVSEMGKMNSGQQLRAKRKKSKDLYFDNETIDDMSESLYNMINKKSKK